MRDHIGQDDYGLGQFPAAQAASFVASTAGNYFLPGAGSIIGGITSLFSSIFGGGPSRHEKSDAAIEESKKYMPRDLPDMIRRIELFIRDPKCTGINFGGGGGTAKTGRAQFVAACVVARKLGFKSDWRACPPYSDVWCTNIKQIKNFFISVLPDLKAGRIPGTTSAQAGAITNIGAIGVQFGGLFPLLLLGGGIYLLTRK